MDKLSSIVGNIELPSSWAWTTLEYILVSIESGSRPKGGVKDISEGIPSIGGEHLLYSGEFDFTNTRYIPNNYFDNMSRGKIYKDDVLVVKDGATTGKTSFVSKSFPFEKAAVNEHVFILRPYIDQVGAKYLFFWMLSPYGQKCVATNFKGTAQGGITTDFVQNSQFPIAPFLEQQRIVAKIEELFTQLDVAEAALKRARANLERYRRSVLQAAVTGQLVEQNLGDEPASHVIHRVWADRKQSQPILPFQADDLPNLPDGWCWTSIEQLTDGSKYAMKAGPFGSALKKEFYVPSGYKIYGQEQVIRNDPSYGDYYISTDLFEKLQSCEVKPGDVLISLVGTIGKVLILPDDIEPGIINPRLVKFSFDRLIIDSRYFKYYLESQSAKDYFSIASHGQTMDVLNLGILKNLPIPLPPVNEQKRIVMEVESFESLGEHEKKVINKSLNRITRLRQSILEEAFQGRLVEQNPEDEPASVLLFRIQAEREEREKQQAAKPKKEKRKMTDEKKRKSLVDVLHAAGTRLTPDELFKRAGFTEESIDEFYKELRQVLQIEIDGKVVKPGQIKEERPNKADIYLSEVQP